VEQCIVIEDPVERCGAENSVEYFAERKRKQISHNELSTITKLCLQITTRILHHVARNVEPDYSPARQFLQQQPRQLTRTASRIQDALIAPQVKRSEHPLSPLKLRRGQAVIFRCVPLARIKRKLRHQTAKMTS